MHVGILGAGTMGLVLALRLGKAGIKTTILESSTQIGGLSTWHDYGDFVWDKFYHVIPRQDESLLDLIHELDLTEKVQWNTTRTGFLWKNRLISMSNYKEFATFPALNAWQKMRLAAGLIICRKWNDPSGLEGKSAEEWLVKVFGRDVFNTIWDPLLESKYGSLKGETPAMIMWATIRRYDSTRSRGNGAEALGFLSGGLRTLLERLQCYIGECGGDIRTGNPVSALRFSDGHVEVEAADGTHTFDRVISTIPTVLLKRLAPDAPGFWNRPLQSPQYLGVICLALVCRDLFVPYYVVNLIQRGFSFAGIIGVSALTGASELNGRHLVMLPRYDVPESPWFDRDPQSIKDQFLNELRQVWPDIDRNILAWHVNRERRVQALWKNVPAETDPRRSNDEKLWSINAELAGRDTLNNNAIVRIANSAAEKFVTSLNETNMEIVSA